MASIPGIFYLSIGVLVAGSSFILNQRNQSNTLTMFIFIGIIFIIIGAIKLFLNKTPEKHKTKHAGQKHTPQTSEQIPKTLHHHTNQNVSQPASRPIQHAPAHNVHQTPPQTANTQFINVSPKNKIEQALLEEEIEEANTKAQIIHPEIVICRTCGRRQYKTRSTCFVCGHPF